MINRRNIRVKVMQTLYTITALEAETKPGDVVKILQKHFDQTRQLFIYLVYFLSELARYAETSAHNRASKHLPTYEDLHVNTKLSGNEILLKINDDPSFKEFVKKDRPELWLDKELVKRIYLDLVESKEYKTYIAKPKREKKEEREILEFILEKFMLEKENFLSHVEENFTNWDDDGEMIILLLTNYLQKPGSYNFKEMISEEKWNFAKDLLQTVREKSEHLESLVIPKLKNWDPERIALLDMILIAKEYSTSQSGQFVNGILDNFHKELVQQGKMHKVDFRKA